MLACEQALERARTPTATRISRCGAVPGHRGLRTGRPSTMRPTANTATSKTLYNLQDETTVQVRFVKLVTASPSVRRDEKQRRRYCARQRRNETSISVMRLPARILRQACRSSSRQRVKPGCEIEGWYVSHVRDDSAAQAKPIPIRIRRPVQTRFTLPKFRRSVQHHHRR